MKWLGPGMLSEHEDNPCYRVAHNWTFLEKQVWVWILRDIKGRPSHKYRNAGDRFECNRSFSVFGGSSQKIRGLTLISPPALCHSWWFCSGSVSAGRGMIPSTTLLDYKTKKKKSQVIDVCVCYKWSDFIRYGRFYIQHSAGWSQHRLENLLWFLTLPFSFFVFWHSSFSGSQQLCHFCVPRQ